MTGSPPAVPDLASFVAGLPKAELHVHHIGSASPQTVAQLAARHEGATPVPADPERLADYFTFTDFAHFVEVYLSVVDLIRDAEDVWTLTYDVARDLAAQQVRYAELTLTPYSSIVRGIAAEAFCEAVEDARHRATQDFGIELRWCFDIPGEAGIPAADVTLDVALRLRPEGLVSFGLGGPELGVPRGHSPSTSRPPAPPACTASRMPVSRPARTRCGTRSRSSAPSASGMASRPPGTTRCCSTCGRTASRSRCARRPTSAPGRCPPLPSTRCRHSSPPASR